MALGAKSDPNDGQTDVDAASLDRPVDLVHLSHQTLGNRSLEREVLSLFRTQSMLYVQKLKDSASHKEWCDAAHTIKGSAKGIGAWQLASCAELAESLSSDDWESGSASVLGELEALIGATNAFIGTLLLDFSEDAS